MISSGCLATKLANKNGLENSKNFRKWARVRNYFCAMFTFCFMQCQGQ